MTSREKAMSLPDEIEVAMNRLMSACWADGRANRESNETHGYADKLRASIRDALPVPPAADATTTRRKEDHDGPPWLMIETTKEIHFDVAERILAVIGPGLRTLSDEGVIGGAGGPGATSRDDSFHLPASPTSPATRRDDDGSASPGPRTTRGG